MAQDSPSRPNAGPSPERRVINAAFEQELGPLAEPSPPPVFGAAGSLLASSEDIPGYEITREIHRGGQGVVYQAVQQATKRTVAIKVMREGPFAGVADKARFEREVQILATLNHPNIVTILDSGMARGSFYYVMTYVPGEPLDLYVARYAPNLEDTLRLFIKVCNVVNAAHLQGVIHRDLKPGNIRVDANGETHILDFGLARRSPGFSGAESALSGMTVTGQFVGSLPWASPEQAEGAPGKIDIRTDVYSLGVILYQMLTGRFPYVVAGSMRDVLDNILKAEPAKPSTIRRQINDEVETIVLKCLSKERDRRYQTAGEFSRDIDHYLKREPIEAKRDSAFYLLRKSLWRYRTPLVLAGTFLVFAVVSALLLVQRNSQRKLAEQHERTARRQTLIQELGRQQIDPRPTGWSDTTWRLATEIAGIERDAVARTQATATLVGLDARATKHSGSSIASATIAWENGLEAILGRLTGGEATALAFAPDWSLMAIGYGRGRIRVWPLRLRGTALELPAIQAQVNALAFQNDPAVSCNHNGRTGTGWLLAAGGASGSIVVWDLTARLPKAYFHGSPYTVDTVAFSPDATLLASGGYETRLWDVTTEQLLLRLDTGHSDAVRFSRDGSTLAVGARTNSAWPQVGAWTLEDGRGIQALRGLAAQSSILRFSCDGALLAALSQEWKVAVWDLKQRGRLLHLFDVPRGQFADNGSLAFSPDGHQLACATWNGVRLWDVNSGQLLQDWALSEGLCDVLVFAGSNEWLLFRVETLDGKQGPTSAAPPKEHPRVCRIRKLQLGQCDPHFVNEIKDFNWHVYNACAPPDGAYFAVDGSFAGPAGWQRMVKIFDATGQELLRAPSSKSPTDGGGIVCDPTGQYLAVGVAKEAQLALYDVAARKQVGTLPGGLYCLSPRAELRASLDLSVAGDSRFALYGGRTDNPLITLGINSRIPPAGARFSNDGRFLAWSSDDGTVSLCNLAEVRRHLQTISLDWRN